MLLLPGPSVAVRSGLGFREPPLRRVQRPGGSLPTSLRLPQRARGLGTLHLRRCQLLLKLLDSPPHTLLLFANPGNPPIGVRQCIPGLLGHGCSFPMVALGGRSLARLPLRRRRLAVRTLRRGRFVCAWLCGARLRWCSRFRWCSLFRWSGRHGNSFGQIGPAKPDVRKSAGQAPGTDRLSRIRISQGGLEGGQHLSFDLCADWLTGAGCNPFGRLYKGGNHLPALSGQLPQPLACQFLLCRSQRLAKFKQAGYLAGGLAGKLVHQPRTHGGAAELGDPAGEVPAPGRAFLGRPLIPGSPELGRGERVQLARHGCEVHRPHGG